MDSFSRWVARHATVVLILSLGFVGLALLPIVDFENRTLRLRVDASMEKLLPEGDEARAFYDRTRDVFGSDDVILIAVAADDIFETEHLERIRRMTHRLLGEPGVHRVVSLTNAIGISGGDEDLEIGRLVTEIPQEPEALEALRSSVMANPVFAGTLVSLDSRAAALVVYLRERAQRTDSLVDLGERIANVAREEAGGATLHITGGPHLEAEASRILLREAVTLPAAVLVLLALILGVAFRSTRGVLVPVVTIGVGMIWALGIISALGYDLNIITVLVPPLLATLGLSYSVHIVSAVAEVTREEPASEGEPRAWLAEALHRVAPPVLLTAATTAVGFASLGLSPLAAVRDFGLLSVIGVACTAVASLTFAPAVFALTGAPTGDTAPRARRYFDRFLERVAGFDLQHRNWILGATGVALALAVVGASQVRVGTQPISKFSPDSSIRRDFEFINAAFGGANMLYVVLESGQDEGFMEPDVLRAVASLQVWLDEQPEIGATTSLADYVKILNRGFDSDAGSELVLPDRRSTVKQLLMFGGSEELDRFVDRSYRTTAIRVRTSVLDSDDVGALTARIEQRLRSLPVSLDAQVTGSSVVFNSTLEDIVLGQAVSMLSALGVIYVVLATMFLSVRVGFIALLPNILPVALYFGALGFSGIRLSPATSLIAPMVLGIAVDDTIHYFARFISESRRLGDERRATIAALQNVGRPVTITTIALCLGFLVLQWSEFSSQAELGRLAAFSFATAWLLDLTLSPALCSRLRIATLWDFLRIDLGPDPQHSLGLLRGLTASQARHVALASSFIELRGGETLFRTGDRAGACYVVIDGGLRRVLGSDEGSLELDSIGRGGAVGVVGLQFKSRTASVVAEMDTRLLRITQGTLEFLQQRKPKIAAQLLLNVTELLAQRTVRANERELERAQRLGELGTPTTAALTERVAAIEAAFFDGIDEELRAAVDQSDERSPLLDSGGDGAPHRLAIAAGLQADTWLAMHLIPLVQVAWADGFVDAAERDAILAGAAAVGVAPGGKSHRLLAARLEREPTPELERAWLELVTGVVETLSVESRLELKALLIDSARTVAEAAGGVLGFGAVSRDEERVLAELERPFGQHGRR